MSTTSPLSTPSSAAVSGLISTQVFHMTVVFGSASSCSQGLLAPLSPRVGERKGIRKNSPSASNCASPGSSVRLSTSALEGVERAPVVFHQPPYCWKRAVKVLISGALKKLSSSLISGSRRDWLNSTSSLKGRAAAACPPARAAAARSTSTVERVLVKG